MYKYVITTFWAIAFFEKSIKDSKSSVRTDQRTCQNIPSQRAQFSTKRGGKGILQPLQIGPLFRRSSCTRWDSGCTTDESVLVQNCNLIQSLPFNLIQSLPLSKVSNLRCHLQSLKATELPPFFQAGSDATHLLLEGVLKSCQEGFHFTSTDLQS